MRFVRFQDMKDQFEKFGNILVRFDIISEPQKLEILEFKTNNPQMHFSEIAAFFGYISKEEFRKVLYLESIEIGKLNKKNQKDEKRVEKRYPIISELQVLDGQKEFKGTTLDISRIGMKFVSDHQFTLKSKLFVSPLMFELKEPWVFYPKWINPLKEPKHFLYGGNFEKEISELDYYIMIQSN
jgi:hypothetical protein